MSCFPIFGDQFEIKNYAYECDVLCVVNTCV